MTLAFLANTTLAASANAFDDLGKMEAAMAKVRSYKSTVTWTLHSKKTLTQVDVVNPDRFRSLAYGGALQFIGVGPNFWFHTAKQGWRRLAESPATSMISTVTIFAQLNSPEKYDATDLGMRSGYHAILVKEKSGKFHGTLYLQRDHLLAAVDMLGDANSSGRITYSGFNAPISIQPPTK